MIDKDDAALIEHTITGAAAAQAAGDPELAERLIRETVATIKARHGATTVTVSMPDWAARVFGLCE